MMLFLLFLFPKNINCFISLVIVAIMEFEIYFNPHKKIVFATIYGKSDFPMAYRTSMEGKRIGEENGCHYFLIDMTKAIVKYSVLDAVNFVVGLNELKFSRHDKVAFIISRDDNIYRFAETVALNRGWLGVKHFTNQDAAEQWLASFQTEDTLLIQTPTFI